MPTDLRDTCDPDGPCCEREWCSRKTCPGLGPFHPVGWNGWPTDRVPFLASLRNPRVRAFLEALPPEDLARRRAFVADLANGETPPEEAYLVDPDPPIITGADREWVDGALP